MLSSTRVVAVAVVLGFLLRAGFGLFYWVDKPLTHDEREYLALATNVWQGRGFTQTLPGEPSTSVQQFGRAPLYPLFLAPLTPLDADLSSGRLPSDVPDAVKIAQSAAGALTVWLIASIARRMAGPRAAMAAALGAAAYPPLVWICAYALSEALYTPLALAAVWQLGRMTDGAERGNAPAVVLAGLLAGLAALTRPAMLFFLPIAACLLVWRATSRRPRSWRRGLGQATLFGVAALLAIAPWTLRNVSTYGRVVLIASEGGVTFWTGNHREARGEGDLAANPHLKALNAAFRAAHPGLSEEALEPLYYREALGFIAEDPLRWLGLLARKLWYTIVPLGPSYRLHSPLYFYASVLSYGLVLLLALLAIPRISAHSPPWSLLALAASAVLSCVVFLPQERFRIPVIDPTLIVVASALATPRRRLV
jgi:4-amino-4-deoxy-L-arabinose transferase-like glycosyltransferase